MDKYLKGTYKKSIFNGENGYIIGLFKVKDASSEYNEYINKTITFTGYFHELNENDTYIFNGNFISHKKYGEQFNVISYERQIPEEKDSIIEFLSSGLFKGIGLKKATKIVSILGKDTLNVILDNPNNLLLIPTITKKQIDILHNTLLEYQSSYNTILELSNLGFNTKESIIIYNKYKLKTSNIVKDNIYNIYFDISDISFKKIDKIAISNNYLYNDKRRIKATIIYVMNEVTNLIGHCYLLIDEIYNNTNKVIGKDISHEEFIECLNDLILNLLVVKNEEKYYLKSIYESEDYIVKRIKYLMNQADTKIKNIDKYINNLELLNNITYDDKQRLAIKDALCKNILIITGGPGTGKTTIIKSIVEIYREVYKLSYERLIDEVFLLAPTGRASKRLSESTLLPASTIHRFLKWNKETNTFSINDYNKSSAKYVIIDEASMIDVNLMYNLLKGLNVDTRLIIVGDYNQLPSVGPGQVLKDLIESEMINTIKLEELYRQKENSNIINLAYDINRGLINKDIFNIDSDLTFIETNDIVSNIKDICNKYKNYNYRDFQVLVPMYKTNDGIDNLNKIIQDIFNPKEKNKKEILVGDVIYRENDKVLQLTNMPEENIYNGDIGIIKSIDKKEIIIDYYDNYVRFTPANFNKFKHGYAISIHKSQGSEFKTVVIPIISSYGKMLYRKLYYTAVTRCKNELILIGEYNSLVKASINNLYTDRRTTLKEKIIQNIKKIE